jgi:hypothetical protein
MQIKLWLESELAMQLLDRTARLHAYEMWQALRGRPSYEPLSIFNRRSSNNGDGLRRASGPDSFDALVEAARREKRAQE